MRSEHEHLRFEDSFVAERKVHSHLVTVKVRVEGGTGQRMELDSLTLDHLRLEGLDTETVQGRSTVQEDGMPLHNMLKDIPHDRILAVYDLLCALDRLNDTALDELADDEGLVELSCHVLRQTALVHLQLRTDDDDRTSGVVDTLTEEVLTEATLLPLKAIGEGLEGTVVIGAYSTGLTRVVEEGVNSFLEHALFVAQDDFRRLDLNHTLQTIVTDDHTTIEVVAEALYDLKALEGFVLTLLRAVGAGTVTQLVGESIEVKASEHVVDRLSTGLTDELLGIRVFEQRIAWIFLIEVIEVVEILLFGEDRIGILLE